MWRRIDKPNTMEGLTDRYTGYVQLKIVEGQINTCFRKTFLPGILFAFGICNITCSYFCVSYATHLFDKLENFFFVSCLVQSGFFFLVVGGFCGMLNKKSKILLSQLKFGSVWGERKLFYKRVKGCSPIKVKFGSNFVDVLTPLRMMVFCIKGTLRLLLLR